MRNQDPTQITSRFSTVKNIGKMAFTESRKARIVAKYIITEFLNVTQRWVRRTVRKIPPTRSTILRWHTRFQQDGNVERVRANERPRVSDQNAEDLRLLFANNTILSTRQIESLLNKS